MSDIVPSSDNRQPRRWSERLGWLRALLQAVQTIAILIRIWHDF